MDMIMPSDPRFLGRTLLKAAVQRQIFDPYTGDVLDMRRAVLIDGTGYDRPDGKGKGTMTILTAANFDAVVERIGGLDKLKAAFGYDFDVYDGRELFGRKLT